MCELKIQKVLMFFCWTFDENKFNKYFEIDLLCNNYRFKQEINLKSCQTYE